MDASPSINSSYRPAQGVMYQIPKPAAHEALQKLVSSCFQDYRIYQPLEGQKVLTPLSKGTFHLLVHPNPVETGYLVFSPRHTPVWMNETLRRSNVIRMRLSTAMHTTTAVFAASLDRSDGILWLEDVLSWNGADYKAYKTFTERRKMMKQFLEHHWMPDDRATGGLHIRVANYQPLSNFEKVYKESGWTVLDLCPEMEGRRRFRCKASGGIDSSLVAQVKAVTGLPDIYELWSADEICVGRAAIQELSLSRTLKTDITQKIIYAEVEWNQNFQKFRIVKLLPGSVPRSPMARFESSKKMAVASNVNTNTNANEASVE